MKNLVTIRCGRRTARAAHLVFLSAAAALLALLVRDWSATPLQADERPPAARAEGETQPLLISLKAGGVVLIGTERASVREPDKLTARLKKAWEGKRKADSVTLRAESDVVYKDIQVVLSCLRDAGVERIRLGSAAAREQKNSPEIQLPNRKPKKEKPSSKAADEKPVPSFVHVIVREGTGDRIDLALQFPEGTKKLKNLKELEEQLRALRRKEPEVKRVLLRVEAGMKGKDALEVKSVCEKAGYRVYIVTRPEEPELDLTSIDLGTDVELPKTPDRLEDISVPGRVDPNAPIGIPSAPDNQPKNIPPPPGINPEGGLGSGTLPGGFGGRIGTMRKKLLENEGGNVASEVAVARGLKWLALHQAKDGHWSLNEFHRHAREKPLPDGKTFTCTCNGESTMHRDVGATALALLPFLGAGITHKPAGKGRGPDYSKTVNAGLRWMVSKQGKDGSFDREVYSHGIATIVLCEAYGLTSDPMLKISAQKALNYMVQAQDPTGGGWRYGPRMPGDLSVTGWYLVAIKSGQVAGLNVPRATLQKTAKFLDSVENKEKKGGYGYVPGAGESISMTAVGLLCRQYNGVAPRNPDLLLGVERLKKNPPRSALNLYYLYYATQVMHHMGGEDWTFWNLGSPEGTGIRDTLLKMQCTDNGRNPHLSGSWDPQPLGCGTGGRIMSTSLSLLCLEIYYRHLPLYRREK